MTHIFTLTVTDNQGSDAATAVTFTERALSAPAARSLTVHRTRITYAWARTGGTGDSSVAPLAPAALLTNFTAETLDTRYCVRDPYLHADGDG